MRFPMRALGALLICLTALAAPAAASAAPSWLPSSTAGNGPDPNGYARTAITEGGTSVTVWKTPAAEVVALVKRPGAAAFETVLADASSAANNPRAAVNQAGDVIVVYDVRPADVSYRDVYARYLARDSGAWTAPQAISPADDFTSGSQADVALDAAGNAVVVYGLTGGSTNSAPIAARRRAADGTLGAVDALKLADGTSSAYGDYPHVAFDSAGKAIVAFNAYGPSTVYRAERPAGDAATFTTATTIVASTDPEYRQRIDGLRMRVVANAAGDVLIAWAGNAGGWQDDLFSVRRKPDGTWGPVKTVGSDSGGLSGNWDVDLDDAGNALAVYGASINASARSDRATGDWTADTSLPDAATTGPMYGLDLDVNAAGDALVVYTGTTGDVYSVRARRTTTAASDTWSAAETVDDGGNGGYDFPRDSRPTVGLDDEGNAIATWQSQVGSAASMTQDYALFDNAAPVADTVTVPSRADAGSGVDVGASFTDRVGPVAYDWDFGDGETDTGATPSHTFAAPGDYTVTVTATDAVGNAAAAQRSITITDTTPPETTITPGQTLFSGDPWFTFSGTDDDQAGTITYLCSVDGESFTGCTSPATLSNLSEGSHTFAVKAKDASDNVDATPAAVTFVVDRTAPAFTFTTPADGAETTDTTPAFRGIGGRASGDDTAVDVYVFAGDRATGDPIQTRQATIGSDGAWSVDATTLALGTYTALACQYDAALNDTCVRRVFRIVAPPKSEPATTGTATTITTTTPPTTETQTPRVDEPQPPLDQQVVSQATAGAAQLLAKLGLTKLVKAGSFLAPFNATKPGKATSELIAPTATAAAKSAKAKKALVVATGTKVVTTPGSTRIRVKLTSSGKRLLKRSKRLTLTLRTTFTPLGGKAVRTTRKITLQRK